MADATLLPETLRSELRERVVVLTVIHAGHAFSPAEVYRLDDPAPAAELACLPTLLEGLLAALGPQAPEGPRRVLARFSGAAAPFLAAWRRRDNPEAPIIEHADDMLAVPWVAGIETLPLCQACPLPEACALRGDCRVDDDLLETQELAERQARERRAQWRDDGAHRRQREDRKPTSKRSAALPWHSLAAVNAQARAEAAGQAWLNAPGVVERVLDGMQTLTLAAWLVWWQGRISQDEAAYRQRIEVHWAATIFSGRHPGFAILPAWHLEQMPDYLRRVYYHQEMFFKWNEVPDLDEVVEGVLWACSETTNLHFQSLLVPEALKTLEWLNQLITDMQEDVAMHAAFFRGLVEDKGLSSE